MCSKSSWKLVIVGVFISVMSISIAQAETPFDITECGAGTVTTVYQSKEITIAGQDGKGIIFSNHENKLFNNFTFHVVVIAQTVDGKRRSDSYWKIMDPDGDIIVAEVNVVWPEKTMKFLHGTGKWKGIKGGAKGKGIMTGTQVVPGTFQACSRYIGMFELLK
jgi:hypothetical protein